MNVLPFPKLENRELSMREQVIERLMQIKPGYYRRTYLDTLKDFALLESLECMILNESDVYYHNT